MEVEWGETFGHNYNVSMSSGTGAGLTACKTLFDLNSRRSLSLRDNEIIVPALAFASTGNVILDAGFKPVFVDIKRETMNINPDLIEEKISDKTRAIMAVHTMGKPCEMDKIMMAAKKHDLVVIEDCCEAHGAKYQGSEVGHFGDMAIYSMYVAHIVAAGNGGMFSTNNKDISKLANSIKNHGRNYDIKFPDEDVFDPTYFDHIRGGLNFRMDDLIAAVALSELKKFKTNFDARRKNLNRLRDGLSDLEENIILLEEGQNETISPHAFSLILRDPGMDYKGLYKFLLKKSIQCKRNFGSMPTQHEAFKFMGHNLGEFPEAEYVGNNGLHFATHQFLSNEDIDYILDVVHEYFTKKV